MFKSLLVGCLVLVSQAAMAADEAPFGLRITWKSKDGTVEWSTLWFESAARRTKEVEEYQRDYGPGGLLEFADRKPIDFEAITKAVSGRIEQPDKALPGEKPGVKPGVKPGATKPAPKPNKKWLIWLEEPRNGRWTKTVENEFTDQRAFYDAYIKAVKSVDDRNRAAGRTVVIIRWKEIEVPKIEKPDLPFVDAKPVEKKLDAPNVVGTRWYVLAGQTLTFEPAGSVLYGDGYGGRHRGTWRQSGERISIDVTQQNGIRITMSGVLEGDEIKMDNITYDGRSSKSKPFKRLP